MPAVPEVQIGVDWSELAYKAEIFYLVEILTMLLRRIITPSRHANTNDNFITNANEQSKFPAPMTEAIGIWHPSKKAHASNGNGPPRRILK